MAELFSDEWMRRYAEEWNNEPELAGKLADIGFSSNIGYGFDGADKPAGIIMIENGQAVAAGAYQGETLNWDLRAKEENWDKWIKKGLGMAGLGMAYASRKLKFEVGDYAAMVKDPRMAAPFIKSFSVMSKI
ncbi:SCP-2 sterol transfer family protein [Ectothiorhodospiraceae bacterium BW-2]|nr:SCP-2 sterol transfer family protein [Ectothiorhodospiraceae bacterium BW-2]